MARYEDIVFLDGDEAVQPIDILYNWQGDKLHVHYQGPTAESIEAAFAYMSAWDYGEPGKQRDDDRVPAGVDTWEERDYRLSAHLGLGSIGLERVLPDGPQEKPETEDEEP